MSEAETIQKTRFQELVKPATANPNEDTPQAEHESDYMWRGQRFRIVPQRQAPLLQFRLVLSPRESMQIKYAYLTHQDFVQLNASNHNEITMIVRDSMRITLAGFNLIELDDALLIQRVIEIQSVSELQAAAAMKRGEDSSVIVDIRLEYGRFDIENRLWLPGNGYWCDTNKCWVGTVPEPSSSGL